MLRGWPIALVAAAGASGLFAFGVIQSAFAPQAQALFIVFAAVLILFVGGNKFFGRGGHGAHGNGGDHAVVMSGKLVGTITMIAAVLAVAYFWTDNEMSGEKVGRYIDQGAVSLSDQAQATFTRLTDGSADESAAEEQQSPPVGG